MGKVCWGSDAERMGLGTWAAGSTAGRWESAPDILETCWDLMQLDKKWRPCISGDSGRSRRGRELVFSHLWVSRTLSAWTVVCLQSATLAEVLKRNSQAVWQTSQVDSPGDVWTCWSIPHVLSNWEAPSG